MNSGVILFELSLAPATHVIVYCTPVYCTLVYCTIADRSDRLATSISLREHANERYADTYQ